MKHLPHIAISMGDPAGIGPEICLRAASDARLIKLCIPIIIGSVALLERVSQRLNIPMPARVIDVPVEGFSAAEVEPGHIDKACGLASARYVLTAIDECLSGRCAAITTAPINKAALAAAELPWPGHTELLAERCSGRAGAYGSSGEIMMMYDKRITVALVTCHQSLSSVPTSLSTAKIVHAGRLLHDALKRLRRHPPRIGVCGLNPHGGEMGLFGNEDKHLVEPAVYELRALGIDAEGPISPDAAFTPTARKRYDGHVVMYHDQGLIPFKALAFDAGVNVTLGLPIVRTSVDHGTAFDIAWKGQASAHSLIEAVLLAIKIAR